MNNTVIIENVDIPLLRRQSRCIASLIFDEGRKEKPNQNTIDTLEGIWNLLENILDKFSAILDK